MPNALTFSTLACPEWSVEEVVARASNMGYDGLEWRGGPQGHARPNLTHAERQALKERVADAGLISLAVTAYSSFVSEDAAVRQTNVEALNQASQMAAEIGATYVRAFLGTVLASTQPEALHQPIAECLIQAADYAHRLGVTIAVEPHDTFVRSASVMPILDKAVHPALKVIWDVGNTFGAGEDAFEGYELLNKRLAYVQVKDGTGRGEQWQLGNVGAGQVPLYQIFELLIASGYSGAFSVEWERAWHPELDPAEIALPHALKTIKKLLTEVQSELA